MRSRIEALQAEPEFRSIIRRFPQAVQTAEGVVIPHFADVAGNAALEAVVCDGAVALRPLLGPTGTWEKHKARLLRHIERELGVELLPEPVKTPLGEVTLEEEWGDFSVWLR